MKTKEDLLKKHSFDLDSQKWLLGGSEILKYQNSEVILIEFTKIENGNWESKGKSVFIEKIDDFDPLTQTYKIKYKVEGEEKEARMIPEGFIFNNPEKDGWAKRFLPYSLHMKMMEEKDFYEKLKVLYEEKETLSMNEINNLRNNKDALQYLNYIAVVIKNKNGEISSFRVNEIAFPTYERNKNSWKLGVKNKEGDYFSLKWKDGEKTLTLSSGEEAKIIDIGK